MDQRVSVESQTIKTSVIVLDCSLELDGKILLLRPVGGGAYL